MGMVADKIERAASLDSLLCLLGPERDRAEKEGREADARAFADAWDVADDELRALRSDFSISADCAFERARHDAKK